MCGREGVHGFSFRRRLLFRLLGSSRLCGFGVTPAASAPGLLLRRGFFGLRHLADGHVVIVTIVVLRLRRLRLQLRDRDVVVVARVVRGRRRRRVALGLGRRRLPSCHARAAAAASSHRCRAAGEREQSRAPRLIKSRARLRVISLAFAGSTEARENALAAAATRPPLLCGAAVSCVRLACVPLLLTKASRGCCTSLVAVVEYRGYPGVQYSTQRRQKTRGDRVGRASGQ